MELAIVAAVLTCFAVTLLVVWLTSRQPAVQVEKRLADLSRAESEQTVESVLKTDSGTFPVLRRMLSGTTWSSKTARELAQAGVSIKVSEYLLLRLLLAAVLGVLLLLLTSGSSLMPLFVMGAGVGGFMVPALIVGHLKSRRQTAIDAQLAEALGLISNSLRSGFAFTQSMELAAKQVEGPIGEEITRFLRDTSLGMPTDAALQALADRTGSYDLEMMVSTILIQRHTGGNLSEILDNVAATVRERQRLQAEIRALTASQRLTGLILSIYPIFLGIVFWALAPEIWGSLIDDELGRFLLVIAATLQIMGIVSIRRILRLEV